MGSLKTGRQRRQDNNKGSLGSGELGIQIRRLLEVNARLAVALQELEYFHFFLTTVRVEVPFQKKVKEFETTLIREALRLAGSQKKAAKLLNLRPTTFHQKMRRHGIDPMEYG